MRKRLKKKNNTNKIYDAQCACGKMRTIRDRHVRTILKNNSNFSCGLCYTFEDWCKDNNRQDYLDLWDYELNDKHPSEVPIHANKKYYFRYNGNSSDNCLKTINNLTRPKSASQRLNFLSFESWCSENNHQDWLNLWDYEMNNKAPKEIASSTHDEYYFKCPESMHESELKRIQTYTKKNKFNHSIICNRCNSFGQYLLDTYGDDAIEKYWSDKNTVNPFKIAKSKNIKVFIICQHCGLEKEIYCQNFLRQGFGCACSTINSYPNKFIHNLLLQLDINSKTEKLFKWSKNKRYDEYIKSVNCIIENHGLQHYDTKHNWQSTGGRSLEDEQNNDSLKESLAKSNGIKYYITLDCRYSEIEWIKNSVMSSELPNLLNFKEEDIDWIECEKFALSNTAKYVCDMWNESDDISVKNIVDKTGLNKTTILDYLNKGTKLGWCKYDAKKEMIKSAINANKLKRKPVEVYKDDKLIAVFESVVDVSNRSENILGVKLVGDIVSAVCRGKRCKPYKGFSYKFSNQD